MNILYYEYMNIGGYYAQKIRKKQSNCFTKKDFK